MRTDEALSSFVVHRSSLSRVMDDALAIGLDLGGTNARAAAVDSSGRIVAASRVPLEDRSPEGAARALVQCARDVKQRCGLDAREVAGIGLGIAGPVDARTGRVLVAPNLGWHDVDFGRLVSGMLGRQVRLANDLAAAALGETRAGAARGHENAILVYVGSGVGGGLVLGGRLHSGATGVAGEFGHTKAVPGGRRCGCGERGCLEAYAGGHNIAARAKEALDSGRVSTLREYLSAGRAITASAVEEHARTGDPLALDLREEAGTLLGVGIANLVTVLNPSVLVLGGGVLNGSPELRALVEEGVRTHAGRPAVRELIVTTPALGDDGGVIGASFLARG